MQNHVPIVHGKKGEFNDSEDLLQNHLRTCSHKIYEKTTLQYFKSILVEDEIYIFFQFLNIDTEATLKEVLTNYRKKFTENGSQRTPDSSGTRFNMFHQRVIHLLFCAMFIIWKQNLPLKCVLFIN